MLSMIASVLGGKLVDALFGNVRGIFESYFNKQITEAQLRVQLQEAILRTFAEVEVAQAEALAKTYSSFMQAMSKSKLMQIMWATALGSQIFVLFWSQWVVPMVHWVGYSGVWRAGTSAEWAYLLIGGLCGLGPVVLRSGPGAGDLATRLRTMVGK